MNKKDLKRKIKNIIRNNYSVAGHIHNGVFGLAFTYEELEKKEREMYEFLNTYFEEVEEECMKCEMEKVGNGGVIETTGINFKMCDVHSSPKKEKIEEINTISHWEVPEYQIIEKINLKKEDIFKQNPHAL